MGFGQQAGPPASHRQINDLLELLQNIGYSDFRDARGPMGFNQRQAGGKFTSEEAQALIDELQGAEWAAEEEAAGIAPTAKASPKKATPAAAKTTPKRAAEPSRVAKARAVDLSKFSSEELAAELQKRGWAVMEP